MYEEVEPNSERWFDLTPLKNEIWRGVKDYEDLYQVSNYGRIKSPEKKQWNRFAYITQPTRILTARIGKDGYISYALYKNGKSKIYKGHRLTITTFIKNVDNKPQINHKDGCKTNNKLNNLEYNTQSENINHAFINGLVKGKTKKFKYNKQDARKCLDKYRNKAIEKARLSNSKKVNVYDINTNKLLYTFNSIKETERQLKTSHINEILKGKRNSKRYIFKEAI